MQFCKKIHSYIKYTRTIQSPLSMKISHYILSITLSISIVLFSSCREKVHVENAAQTTKTETSKVVVPKFNATNAYKSIEQQVSFGPRVPGSKAWQDCSTYILSELKKYTPVVLEQKATVSNYENKKLPVHNIMAQFNPEQKKRILIASHWDSRPWADHDDENKEKPILAADDGGSGVGIMIELARLFTAQNPQVGVDLLFIDTEETGPPDYLNLPSEGTDWCLGSQYWARNKMPAGYQADMGILLDMVGGRGNTFTMESTSMTFAPQVMQKVWDTANRLGYSTFFLYEKTSPITDDHLFINQIANIPMIDIINYRIDQDPIFGKRWHTHDDNMEGIDSLTLKAVGTTVATFVYEQGSPVQ